MPQNFQQQLLDRIWVIWESSPQFVSLVKPGNRVKTDDRPGWLKLQFMGNRPADFPWISLDVIRATHSAWDRINTFDVENDDFNLTEDEEGNSKPTSSGEVERKFDVRVVFMSQVLQIYEQDLLVEVATGALLAAGASLGIREVNGYGPITTEQSETNRDLAKGTRRLQTIMQFTVTALFEMRDLVAQSKL